MNNTPVSFQLLEGFDDPRISQQSWNALLQTGGSNTIFLTHQYQKTWWEVFGRGKLLLIAACLHDRPFAIAPLFADSEMIFFVGSGGSDYLDFIGDVQDEAILQGILQFARKQVTGFLGFRFYHVLRTSETQHFISALEEKKAWETYDEGSSPAPQLSIKDNPEHAHAATCKKSLVRHQAWFERDGNINTAHFRHADDILPLLDDFFDQHIARWAETDFPSLFHETAQRTFYRRLCEALSPTGWLRFTRLTWQGQSIAFHFGFCYEGAFLWYKPSFCIALAKHSPGEVLIRQLLLHSLEEGAHTFDFGLGEEGFKMRFATKIAWVTNTGLYPLKITCNA